MEKKRNKSEEKICKKRKWCGLIAVLFIVGMIYVGEDFEKERSSVGKVEELQEDIYKKKESQENNILQFDNWNDLMREKEIPYADESTIEVIKEAYSEINFIGEIKNKNMESSGEHIEEFCKLLQNEMFFYDGKENDEFYIMNYGSFAGVYDPNRYTYYFFDVDEDENNLPELTIINDFGELYIFKYKPQTKQCVLWCKLESCWYSLVGSRKVLWTWDGGKYLSFYQLNVKGEIEYETFFGSTWFNEEESLYMVMMPKYAEKQNEESVTQEMKTQGAYVCSTGQWYFRVTEEQYNELTEEYWVAYNTAMENLEEVTYTYEEWLELVRNSK